ncbi:MAG TPA: NAD(P)H-quinone oxidoreductase [Gammaproteobacteria bacterium]
MKSVADKMQIVEVAGEGDIARLVPATRALPVPETGEVLIKVEVAGVNRPDVFQRRGLYPPPRGATDIPGLEVAGRIVALGDSVSRWKGGERVCALLAGGGYAEYVSVPAALCLPVPSTLTMKEAAAIPETFCTVWSNVFMRAKLRTGENFLVHGGSGGIGTTAIQLTAAFGARVFTSAGSDEKCRACERLGAEKAVNYRDEDFVAVFKDATDGYGMDVILDMVGGSYIGRNIELAAVEGRIMFIAFLEGARAEINFSRLMFKRLMLGGSTLRSRSLEFKSRLMQDLYRHIWPLFESGQVKPQVSAEYPLHEAQRAHELMEAGGHFGKIVLTVDG